MLSGCPPIRGQAVKRDNITQVVNLVVTEVVPWEVESDEYWHFVVR